MSIKNNTGKICESCGNYMQKWGCSDPDQGTAYVFSAEVAGGPCLQCQADPDYHKWFSDDPDTRHPSELL